MPSNRPPHATAPGCAHGSPSRQRGATDIGARKRTRRVEGMFESIRCFGLDTRTLRVHVPAVPDSSLSGVTVSLQAGQSTYRRPGADCCRQQLRPGVAMTFDDKSRPRLFFGRQAIVEPLCLSSVGASHSRRVLLRLAGGGLPPALPPSGACRTRGPRRPAGHIHEAKS